ncbi:HAD family hydrolase [Promicromonospora sukumoe]|uniref:HAD family hydrolase n=1 Tax=Promicromonospora sukumoe TaxID=88382 RepID=UPI0004784BC2|nr:HAD family hydrolase [Promicromonospora sukumoe]
MTTTRMIACDIDGTLLRTGRPPTPAVQHATQEVLRAGHHIVLATGRSVKGAVSAARQLGLRDVWMVTSNGAVTAHLVGEHYQVVEEHDVDATTVIDVARREAPAVRVAAEIVGVGWRVSAPFPGYELNGAQRQAPLDEFLANPTPRIALHGPDAHRMVPALIAQGVTAIATRLDWVDVTPPAISKASALEKVRIELGVDQERTVAIGDGENDIEMFGWAAHAVAMGHASPFVLEAASHRTGSLDDEGAASALLSLLGQGPGLT